jgi:putative phosphoesterase
MRIGIMSDTHDNVDTTRRALDHLRASGIEQIIHCGDITSPEIVAMFAGWMVAFVWGNMDQSRPALRRAVEDLNGATIDDQFVGEIEGVQLAACHGDDPIQLDSLITCGLYDYVFYGHTHRRHDETVGETRVINPGALGGTRRETRSLCVIDLPSGAVDFVVWVVS